MIQKILLISLILFAVSSPLNPVKAEEIQSTSNKVTVVPAKFEIGCNQGEGLTEYLKISNEETEDAIVALSIENFGSIGEDGEVILNSSSSFQNDLKKWITFNQKSMQFKAKETKTVSYKIDVPKEARPGGQYASIVVSVDRVNRAPGQSTASARVVSLVMLSVLGDIKYDASVQSFNALKNNSNNNYNFELRIKNKANDHIIPKGTIVITNIWGTKIDEVNLVGENVLPNTVRKMNTSWSTNRSMLGRYTATMVATYGHKGDQHISSVTTFWVIPWFYLIALILIAIILTLFFFEKKQKSSRNHIRQPKQD